MLRVFFVRRAFGHFRNHNNLLASTFHFEFRQFEPGLRNKVFSIGRIINDRHGAAIGNGNRLDRIVNDQIGAKRPSQFHGKMESLPVGIGKIGCEQNAVTDLGFALLARVTRGTGILRNMSPATDPPSSRRMSP